MNDSTPIYLNDLLFSLSRALDYVEKEVFGVHDNHGKRIALMSMRLCQTLGYSDEDVLDMASCSVLHDNALTLDAVTLHKSLTPLAETFHEHCTLGEKHSRDFPFLHSPKGIILHHHENWDGTGFFALRGDEITPRATILRLTDELDLLFAKKFDFTQGTLSEIQAYVRKNTGTLFSPAITEAFLDTCTLDFLEGLRKEEISASIKQYMPNIAKPMTLDELLAVCRIFSHITDIKSYVTATHCKGVANITKRLAQHWNIDSDHTKKLMVAAHLHDVGKLTVPAAILEKPAELTKDEFHIMKNHVNLTAELLSEIKGLGEIATWAASHHEKLNGKGYPLGLVGEKLPFESRLLACADIYQALIEDRPYRAGMSHEQAMEVLQNMASRNEIDFDLVESMSIALDPQKFQDEKEESVTLH